MFRIREDEEARSTKVGTPAKGALPNGMLSPSDTALVFLLALLLFGPEQLPRIARQLGEAMRHIQSTTHTFMNEMERAARTSDAHDDRPAYSKDGAEAEPPHIEAANERPSPTPSSTSAEPPSEPSQPA